MTAVIRSRCEPDFAKQVAEFCAKNGYSSADLLRMSVIEFMANHKRRTDAESMARTIAQVQLIDPGLADELRKRVSAKLPKDEPPRKPDGR